MIITTSLLFVVFQTTINTTTATNITSVKLLDESILKLKLQNLRNDINGLRKLLGPCLPCKSSTKNKNLCDCTNIEPRKDCLEFYQHGYKINGVYLLKTGPGFYTLHAYCDQTTQGGGWTVFQRRQDGSVDFRRKWIDYKVGFGNLEGEFWFGNENIYDLTQPSFAPKKSQLLINMKMKGNQNMVYVKYDKFEVTNEKSKYTLKITGLTGNKTLGKNAMDYHNGMKFTTHDSENSKGSCKNEYGGTGWWYNNCSKVNLNAPYKFTGKGGEIFWNSFKSQPKFVEMKMRRNL